MSGWWEAPGRGTYWVEIRKVLGIGEELYCNARNEAGGKDSRYELVRQVRAGDVVFHYNADESRFVGRSVAATDAVVTEQEYRVPLANFESFSEVIDLERMRTVAPSLYEIRDRLLNQYGKPLHLPFQFRDDPSEIRMLSNYFARLPEEMIELLFGSVPPAQDSSTPKESTSPATGVRRVGGFLAPFKPKRDTQYIAKTEARAAIRDRNHETLVNDCAEWLVSNGFEAARNAAIDLGVREPSIIIEAKTVGGTWALPIRQAVSQLYEYRYFEVVSPESTLLLLAPRELPESWLRYLEDDRQIGAIWPLEGGGYAGSSIARQVLPVVEHQP